MASVEGDTREPAAVPEPESAPSGAPSDASPAPDPNPPGDTPETPDPSETPADASGDTPSADEPADTPSTDAASASTAPSNSWAETTAPPARIPSTAAMTAPTYTPPPSPAYADQPQRLRVVAAPTAPASTGAPAATGTATTLETVITQPPGSRPLPAEARPSSERGWTLLYAGLALVSIAVLAAVGVVIAGRGGSGPTLEFGEVAAASEGVVVRLGEGGDERALEVGDTVVAGWVVDAGDDGSVEIDLVDGGVVRFDSGARVTFTHSAAEAAVDDGDAVGDPVVVVTGGRAWVNPAGADAAADLALQIAGGTVTTTGAPVALDCTAVCSVEAPAGGVTVTNVGGREAAPAADEVVALASPQVFDVTFADGPSAWARLNIGTDEAAGLASVGAGDAPGIRAAAVLDGTFDVTIDVVDEPTGDPIPVSLRYPAGQSYTLMLTADGSGCARTPCDVPVEAADGASGSAEIAGGEVTLRFSQAIDCYDESFTTVVVPGIGTTTVEATLEVTDVTHDGDGWKAAGFAGDGTVAAELTTECNPGDVLGTSTSSITIRGS
jgi:hypothetical protein